MGVIATWDIKATPDHPVLRSKNAKLNQRAQLIPAGVRADGEPAGYLSRPFRLRPTIAGCVSKGFELCRWAAHESWSTKKNARRRIDGFQKRIILKAAGMYVAPVDVMYFRWPDLKRARESSLCKLASVTRNCVVDDKERHMSRGGLTFEVSGG